MPLCSLLVMEPTMSVWFRRPMSVLVYLVWRYVIWHDLFTGKTEHLSRACKQRDLPMLPSRNSDSCGNCYWYMAHGVIRGWPNWSFVSKSPIYMICLISSKHSFFLQEYYFRFDSFLGEYLFPLNGASLALYTSVLVVQWLFWSDCLWGMVDVLLQCCLHHLTSSCNWYIWSVRFRSHARPLPSALSPWPAELLFYPYSLFLLGRQRVLPQYRK